MPATLFDITEAIAFLRKEARRHSARGEGMLELTALSHADNLERIAGTVRAQTITIPDSERIDPYRPARADGRHDYADGHVA
jgi:hypothetical protein